MRAGGWAGVSSMCGWVCIKCVCCSHSALTAPKLLWEYLKWLCCCCASVHTPIFWEKSFITAETSKMLGGGGCEARPSGWHGKGAKAGKPHPRSMLAFGWPPLPVMSFLWLRCTCVSWPRLLPRAGPRCWCHIPACKGYAESITHHHVRHTPVLQETSISFFHDPPSASH